MRTDEWLCTAIEYFGCVGFSRGVQIEAKS